MLKTIVVWIIAILLIADVKGYCYTAWGAPGRCVNIKQCNTLLKLLRPKPIGPTVLRVLRKAQCGFDGLDPKVCCQIANNIHNDNLTPTSKTFVVSDDANEKTTMATPSTTLPSLVPLYDHPNRHLLNDEQCGPILEGRIYGGNVTSIYEFPWMALLGFETGNDVIEFRCGGSLINEHYVLTAAHCVTELPEDLKLTTVRIGDHDLMHERDCDYWENGVGYNCAKKYQDFGIGRVHVHADFSRHKLYNDIALVRLDSTVDLSPPSVRPICLPLGEAAFLKSSQVVVSGWGSTEFGTRSQRLLKVTLPIVNMEKCSSAYKYQMINIWQKQICAGGTNEMDSCSGDSGGPLQAVDIYHGKPRNIIYGIVSFGAHSCGIPGIPGVYTNVAYYVDWILDTITD